MKSIWIILLFLLSFELNSQNTELRLRFVDAETQKAVPDVHVFLENSSYGTVSDPDGMAYLSIPDISSGDILISHISYDSKFIEKRHYQRINELFTIALEPIGVEVSELLIQAKRSKKWKKRFKTFKRSFLGEGDIAKNCEILNPEVLRFSELNGSLYVEAVDLIHIDNPILAYEIYYLLTNMEISEDGSVEYSGRALFVDNVSEAVQHDVENRRREVYHSSSKYFFNSLIKGDLEKDGFKVRMVSYENGVFKALKEFGRGSLLNASSDGKKYTLEFDEFLEVYNEASRKVSYSQSGVRPGGLESQRFSGSIQEEKEIVNYEKSYFFKLTPYLILDRFGNVLNSKDVKEYGFWAKQKMAYQLPVDYTNKLVEVSRTDQYESGLSADRIFRDLKSLIYDTDSSSYVPSFYDLTDHWLDAMAAPLIEILRFRYNEDLNNRIHVFLSKQYDISGMKNYSEWLQWLWDQGFAQEEFYFDFKSELYKNIDPKFANYFSGNSSRSLIGLEEIVWGGVKQDGIPPLRSPKMIPGKEADYLAGSDIVFGLFINGQAKAYPKRILAWHEFFTDEFGDTKVAGVYCTLCGTLIAYNMNHKGIYHELGTSGFLYGSNKLMYDEDTQSLWSTIDGKPLVGELIDKEIVLESFPVVTSSWNTWLSRHPDTEVLALATGYDRDYSEGVAYREYFATDELMFPVKHSDNRLKNKDEVLIVRIDSYNDDPVAISKDYILDQGWIQERIADQEVLVVSDESGALRAYSSMDVNFVKMNNRILVDELGIGWTISEDYIESESGRRLFRVPSHTIFWFAWYNAYPDTRLIK